MCLTSCFVYGVKDEAAGCVRLGLEDNTLMPETGKGPYFFFLLEGGGGGGEGISLKQNIFEKIFEGEIFIRIQSTVVFHLFCEISLYSEVTFKSIKEPDDTVQEALDLRTQGLGDELWKGGVKFICSSTLVECVLRFS